MIEEIQVYSSSYEEIAAEREELDALMFDDEA